MAITVSTGAENLGELTPEDLIDLEAYRALDTYSQAAREGAWRPPLSDGYAWWTRFTDRNGGETRSPVLRARCHFQNGGWEDYVFEVCRADLDSQLRQDPHLNLDMLLALIAQADTLPVARYLGDQPPGMAQ